MAYGLMNDEEEFLKKREELEDIPVVESEIDPAIKEYLAKKYPERLSSLSRDREEELSKFDSGNRISGGQRFLASLSGALTGNDSGKMIQNLKQSKALERKALEDKFERQERGLKGQLDLERDELDLGIKSDRFEKEKNQFAKESDPNSPESMMVKDLAKSMGYKGDLQNLTADKWKSLGPFFQKKYDIEMSRLDRAEARKARQDELDIRRAERDAKRSEEAPKRAYNNLPEEKKQVIEGLAKKNANKIAISNQIDAVIQNWDKLSDKEKLVQGRQMIKTLNSLEGSDAVGAEESKRLGSNLEFAMGNLTNDNPVQFGRDLEGFKKQAMDTSAGIKRAIEMNNKQIDEAYGRTPSKTTSSPDASSNKSIVKQEYSPSRNQTRITYSDGTTEIKDGR